MSRLTPLTKWNPEDDLLLKNAVEAGASLESLAKGAVRFSCRFTLRELEERWRLLLYDLNTSTEASACIIEIEIGVSVYNPSKSGRTCNNKVKETTAGKRKGESLQYHYHATRKRARNEVHKSSNLEFLVPPRTDDVIANDTVSHDPSELQNGLDLCNYGHPESSYGSVRHAYHSMVEVESTVPSSGLTVHGRMAAPIDTEHPVGISDSDCLYGQNISSVQINEAGLNDACENFQSSLRPKDLPHTLDRSHLSLQPPDVSPTSAFHQLVYSSPPDLPIWRTIEDVSTSNFQMDSEFVEKGQRVLTLDCIKEMDDQACDNVTSKSKLTDDTSTAALHDSTTLLNTNYMDLSSTCISFTDEEELLLIDMNEEDIRDRSCLNGLDSMFLSSPSDTHTDSLPIPSESMPSEAFDNSASKTDTNLEHKTIHEDIHIGSSDLNCSVVTGVTIPPSSPEASHIEDLPCCLLNTEDPDIPCNDDVIFPVKLSQAFPAINTRQNASSTLVNYEKPTCGDPTFVSVQTLQPKVGLLHSAADHMPESLPSNMDLVPGVSRVNFMDDPKSIPTSITSQHSQDLALNQETMNELNVQVARKQSHPDLASTELVDHLPTISISDQEEEAYENENDDVDDVPSFSDVEAMILDMDLSPYDQESCLFAKEVSRYQCVGTKKAFIRLEQGARSYINRAISSHGAFAVFYGRHLKYFIKTPEVLVGRETEDIKVDIDLAKEGRANKISRRQAIIKMDGDGCFHLKNIGKSSLFVNSKEVPVKKRINLSSCALIEIKDMRFIFDVNEAAVRRHISSSRQCSHVPKSNFDFVYN